MASAYDFAFTMLNGEPFPLSALKGLPFIVVNTASQCGFTPQYQALQAVWKQYREAGLTVIGVPCNDFGGQEPGSEAEIGRFCAVNYGVDFPMMSKVHVKGPQAHPFFKWVADEGGFLARPRWNFYKYLINKDGELEDWFVAATKPDSKKFTAAIQKLLY